MYELENHSLQSQNNFILETITRTYIILKHYIYVLYNTTIVSYIETLEKGIPRGKIGLNYLSKFVFTQ